MQNYLQSFFIFSSNKDNIDCEKTMMMILQSDIEGCGYGSDNHHSQVHAFSITTYLIIDYYHTDVCRRSLM